MSLFKFIKDAFTTNKNDTSSFNKTEDLSKQPKRGHSKLQDIGNVESICPHCNKYLEKRPGAKKKCPHCGEFIFVRTRPSDEKRVLVTKEQAELIEEQWSIVNGTHEEFLERKKRFQDEKAELVKRLGYEPSENDIKWSLLSKDLIKFAKMQDWGLYRNTKFQMAEILRKESKFQDALAMYIDVCYLDINGPSNLGGISDPTLLKEFPPFNPKDFGFLAPGVLNRIDSIMKKLKIDREEIHNLFTSQAEQLSKSLGLPVSVKDAWQKFQMEFFDSES